MAGRKKVATLAPRVVPASEITGVRLAPVISSNVEAAGYMPELGRLVIRYQGGSVYVYYRVPAAIWVEFQAAQSKGQYLAQCVKGNPMYAAARVAV